MGIREAWANRVIDLVWGMAGTFAALQVARRLDAARELIVLTASLVVLAVALVAGWRAYRRRAAAAGDGPSDG